MSKGGQHHHPLEKRSRGPTRWPPDSSGLRAVAAALAHTAHLADPHLAQWSLGRLEAGRVVIVSSLVGCAQEKEDGHGLAPVALGMGGLQCALVRNALPLLGIDADEGQHGSLRQIGRGGWWSVRGHRTLVHGLLVYPWRTESAPMHGRQSSTRRLPPSPSARDNTPERARLSPVSAHRPLRAGHMQGGVE